MCANYSRNPKWLHRDRNERPEFRERVPVTVCVATLFRWNYGPSDKPEYRFAALVASDRMITAGDVQYEPQQLKVAFITKRAVILIAGDYSLHSEAILGTSKQIQGQLDITPHNLALIYGRAIQSIKHRQAEDLYLAALGMNADTFLAQQRDLSADFVDRITNQIQGYQGPDVEALVVGSDGENAHIYAVDTKGIVSYLNDVGFAAIGIGAWHAKSKLMQAGYINSVTFAPALAAIFAAKKNAEVAPGVGTATDIHVILKDHTERLSDPIAGKLEELYKTYDQDRRTLETSVVSQLQNFITPTTEAGQQNAQGSGIAGTNTQANEGTNPPAAEAPRKDEGGETQGEDG